jgi:ATP-dependent protease ClpP protease subunit
VSQSQNPKRICTSKTEPRGFGLRMMDVIQNEGVTHQETIALIEAVTQRNFISYSSFFQHPAGIIDDNDPHLLETLLQSIDLTKYPGTLDLMISSPGGSPTAAERIVLTCRSYARSFRVIVPQSAMSAATMVAMGADAILMTPTAELGPIDPQMVQRLPDGQGIMRPAKAFIDAYLDLVNKSQEAIANNQPPHPFIELLRKVDPPWVQVCLKARELAKKIVSEFLSKWMLNGKQPGEIEAVVMKFVTEGEEGSHGRAIRHEKAKEFGLEKVEVIPTDSELWRAIWELQERSHLYVQSRGLAKYLVARNGGINVQAKVMQIN